jgi:two-component system, cell cycle response regulator DivK
MLRSLNILAIGLAAIMFTSAGGTPAAAISVEPREEVPRLGAQSPSLQTAGQTGSRQRSGGLRSAMPAPQSPQSNQRHEFGERGCAIAVAERPDIILMDLEMPGIDGWEATRRLKSNLQMRDIAVVALCAHALAGTREKALAVGCDEFDTKPLDFDRLLETIRRLLHGGTITTMSN